MWVICIAHKFVFLPTYFADRKEYRLGQKNFSIKHNQQKMLSISLQAKIFIDQFLHNLKIVLPTNERAATKKSIIYPQHS